MEFVCSKESTSALVNLSPHRPHHWGERLRYRQTPNPAPRVPGTRSGWWRAGLAVADSRLLLLHWSVAGRQQVCMRARQFFTSQGAESQAICKLYNSTSWSRSGAAQIPEFWPVLLLFHIPTGPGEAGSSKQQSRFFAFKIIHRVFVAARRHHFVASGPWQWGCKRQARVTDTVLLRKPTWPVSTLYAWGGRRWGESLLWRERWRSR